MSDAYHPPQRAIPLRLLTDAGWVSGTLRIPAKSRLVEFLEHAHELVSLTDVKVESKADRLPFMAVRRSSVLLIIAGELESTEPTQYRPLADHDIECMFPYGWVSGRISSPRDLRLSDQLSMRPSFFVVVHGAHVRMRDPWSSERIDIREPVVLLNTREIVGVTEVDPEHAARGGMRL